MEVSINIFYKRGNDAPIFMRNYLINNIKTQEVQFILHLYFNAQLIEFILSKAINLYYI